jgi:hypothetical protein
MSLNGKHLLCEGLQKTNLSGRTDLPLGEPAEGMEAWREVQVKTNHKV